MLGKMVLAQKNRGERFALLTRRQFAGFAKLRNVPADSAFRWEFSWLVVWANHSVNTLGKAAVRRGEVDCGCVL